MVIDHRNRTPVVSLLTEDVHWSVCRSRVHCGKTVSAQQDEQNKAQKAKEKQAGNNEVRVQNYKQKKNVQYIMTRAKHILQKIHNNTIIICHFHRVQE